MPPIWVLSDDMRVDKSPRTQKTTEKDDFKTPYMEYFNWTAQTTRQYRSLYNQNYTVQIVHSFMRFSNMAKKKKKTGKSKSRIIHLLLPFVVLAVEGKETSCAPSTKPWIMLHLIGREINGLNEFNNISVPIRRRIGMGLHTIATCKKKEKRAKESGDDRAGARRGKKSLSTSPSLSLSHTNFLATTSETIRHL